MIYQTLEAYSQMKPKAICSQSRSKEDMQILITSDSYSRLPSTDKEHITFMCITVRAGDFLDITRSCVQVAVECKSLTFSHMPISPERKT